jgi:hypothetical protein
VCLGIPNIEGFLEASDQQVPIRERRSRDPLVHAVVAYLAHPPAAAIGLNVGISPLLVVAHVLVSFAGERLLLFCVSMID